MFDSHTMQLDCNSRFLGPLLILYLPSILFKNHPVFRLPSYPSDLQLAELLRQAEVQIGSGCVKGASCLVPVIPILTGLGVFRNYKLHTGLCQQRFMWSVGAKLKAPTARIPIVLRPPSKPLLVANSTPHLREQWFISGIRHDACVSPVPHTHQSPLVQWSCLTQSHSVDPLTNVPSSLPMTLLLQFQSLKRVSEPLTQQVSSLGSLARVSGSTNYARKIPAQIKTFY